VEVEFENDSVGMWDIMKAHSWYPKRSL